MNIVLVEPEIPPNTGNVARLCAATGAVLHLVGPLGFRLDDRELKRAGMDYWEQVTWKYWESLAELRSSEIGSQRSDVRCQNRRRRAAPEAPSEVEGVGGAQADSGVAEPAMYYVTTKSQRAYTAVKYRWGDYLVFGRETAGLPAELLAANEDRTITIPMFNPQARSLNLATAVAVVLFHAIHQVKSADGTWPVG